MSMKEQGVARIGAAIQANIDQARHPAGRIEGEPRLELLAPVSLNTVCFRYAGSVPDELFDALSQEILTELQVRGITVPKEVTPRNEAIRLFSRNPTLIPGAAEAIAADLSNQDDTLKAVRLARWFDTTVLLTSSIRRNSRRHAASTRLLTSKVSPE
jgi:glutamate/tyrosine decarboxylase-like PLP-dependent enzyme